jgi:probable F420-dependent oxidoreductase
VVAVHTPDDAALLAGFPQLAAAIERSGYDGIWVGEVNGIDAVTAATLVAGATGRADIGVVLNTFTRAPSTLAMTAGSLGQIAGARVHVVLGVASPLLVGRWAGIPYVRPHERLRDVLRFLRAALAGGRVTGEFPTLASEGFALSAPPAEPPQLLIAACGPRALHLAATEADGVVLNWVTPDDLDRIDPLPDRPRVSFVVPVCPTADRVVMEAVMRPVLADYLQAPAYAEQQRRLGRGDALAPMWDAWAAGDRRGARAALQTSTLDELVVWGDPRECRARLGEMASETAARPIAAYFVPPGETYAGAVCSP